MLLSIESKLMRSLIMKLNFDDDTSKDIKVSENDTVYVEFMENGETCVLEGNIKHITPILDEAKDILLTIDASDEHDSLIKDIKVSSIRNIKIINVEDALRCMYAVDSKIDLNITDADGNKYNLQDGDMITMIVQNKSDYSVLLQIQSSTKEITLSSANSQALGRGEFSYHIILTNSINNYSYSIVPYSKLIIY